MLSERGRGRLVGGLTFLQLVGLIVPFVLLLPIVTPPGAYLADAAASSTRVLAGVLLLVVNGAVTIGISIAAWPALRRRSEALGRLRDGRCLSIGLTGDIPLVGDWDATGSDKVGTFRPSDGTFYVDYNGNGAWDGCGTDRCLQIGMSGDTPLVGKW